MTTPRKSGALWSLGDPATNEIILNFELAFSSMWSDAIIIYISFMRQPCPAAGVWRHHVTPHCEGGRVSRRVAVMGRVDRGGGECAVDILNSARRYKRIASPYSRCEDFCESTTLRLWERERDADMWRPLLKISR